MSWSIPTAAGGSNEIIEKGKTKVMDNRNRNNFIMAMRDSEINIG